SHGDGLRVRSADGAVRLLTFEDQRWNVAHGGADMPVREPVPAGTRGFGLSLRLQHEGPDAVGADTSVLMYWERESDGGDVLTLVTPDRCPADTNDDGTVTPADFKAWTRAYNAEFPACDQNGDGLCNPADFNAWVFNFNTGCP
ncbi:MAG: GC-type dockerin domain-anchored protein, partial [Planctomycetota bacterium]